MHLTEDELNTLVRTVTKELARRNLRFQPEPTSGQEKEPKQALASAGKKTDKRATPGANALPLTQSRINAIRAAFKAGVKPSTIARQFGVSRSAIQQALSDKADQ
jgi:DNA invertase Pin-like site-specific DNA recombinase